MKKLEKYNKIKDAIQSTICSIYLRDPMLGEYLKSNIIMDNKKKTFCYTGDDRVKIEKLFNLVLGGP